MGKIIKIDITNNSAHDIGILKDFLSDNDLNFITEETSESDKAIIDFDNRKFKRVKTDVAFQPCYNCDFLMEGFKCSQSMNMNIKCWVGNDKYYIYKEVKK